MTGSYDLQSVVSAGVATLIVTIVVFLVSLSLLKGRFRDVLNDEKGYPSLTNFQFLAWTVVYFVSILWIYFIRIQGGLLEGFPGFQTQALVLMGINSASVVASKAISGQVYEGLGRAKAKDQTFSRMLYEESPKRDFAPAPALSRVQLFVWTIVSILIFVATLFGSLLGPFLFGFEMKPLDKLAIPDVDPSLVTLMGLSHAAFLGGKYYTQKK